MKNQTKNFNESSLSHKISTWLLKQGSLTKHLQQTFGYIEVEICREGFGSAYSLEQKHFSCEAGFVREIFLKTKTTYLILARTFIKHDDYQILKSQLEMLGDKPIGSLLFKDNIDTRQSLDILCIDASYPLRKYYLSQVSESLWGRVSLFFYEHCEILITEIFLPEVYNELPYDALNSL